ncbi:MAG: class I SAM-dependent methyltransferase [Chitinophagaceae bacterium]|nr:class I SAM-dependent methyltransferase [Chitinophagaceae bacterium]MCW5905680.1 class I SAM-dependent methyltransferase [Chitinophagaceae bacterium]
MQGNALIHLMKYYLGFDKPNSQTSIAEQECIKKYAQNSAVCLEIGVFEGVNTLIIANSMDPFFKGKMGICYYELIAKSELRKKNLLDRVKFISKFSFNASEDVPNGIDFIFIDGDHSLEGIKKDWEIFSQKIKSGGMIALHDTSIPNHNPSVKGLGSYQYFNEYIIKDNRFEYIETVDSLNVMKRK